MVITGAAGGLGTALARRFDSAGCRLGLLDIDGEGLESLGPQLGTQGRAVRCDVTNREETSSAIETIQEALGPIDVLINNAGLTQRSAFADTEPDVFRRVMDVNYMGAINVTTAALPSIIEQKGAIGVVTSVAGFAPIVGRAGYAGSKHALHGTFAVLRSEVRPMGVDVTIFAPTFIETGFGAKALDGDGSVTSHPQSRVGSQVSPNAAAERFFEAIESRKRLATVGVIGHLTRVMTAVMPGTYERLMSRALSSELDR